MSQGVHLRKYGVQTTIDFELYEVDGVDFRTDAADAGSDCSIMKDEGAEATCTNDFTDEGKGYSLVLTATEMEAARIVVYVVDSAAKVWLDKAIIIETYGNASAIHAFDLDTATQSINVATWLGQAVTLSTGNKPDVNIDEVSDDATAASDLELFIENAKGTDHKALLSADAQDLSATLDVNTKTITNGIIVAATLGADCITAAKIADDAIAAEHLATGAIVAATFAANAITSTVIADNTITAAKLNADCITAAKIADDAISSEHLNTGAITADAFAADAIVAATLATGCLTADAFAADSIVAATLATDAIAADALATDAITEIINAIKAMTGVTVGGTKTFAQWCAIVGAAVAGDVSDGDSSDYNYGDIDDNSEVFASVIAATSPYRDVTIA